MRTSPRPIARTLTLALALLFSGAAPSWAQHEHHPAADEPQEPKSPEPTKGMEGMEGMAGMDDMPGMHGMHEMHALYGPYAMTRESSGTAWQPDSAPHEGYHFTAGSWQMMAHGMATLVYDDQDGRRGDRDVFSSNMLMVMGSRQAGRGRLGLRAMASAEPWTIGKGGYPLLLQTGETADGTTHLVDRQHPHDLFMELAATYSLDLAAGRAVVLYAGLPGEPALGPPAFMHRFAAMENPEAPLSHHWLDSTHITYGVTTLGFIAGRWKLEGSVYTGREPDEDRTGIESPKMDSWSGRLSWNPTADWSLQVSHGHLHSPEQLEPEIDTDRTTASAIYNRRLAGGNWQSLLAWGRNAKRPGTTTDSFLLESALAFDDSRNTLFARAERQENDELVPGQVATVGKLTAGYVRDLLRHDSLRLGLGGLASVAFIPSELEASYGERRPLSSMVFLRLRN